MKECLGKVLKTLIIILILFTVVLKKHVMQYILSIYLEQRVMY